MGKFLFFILGIGIGILLASKKRRKKFKTDLILITIINKSKLKFITMQLDTQKFVDAMLALVDHATGNPIDATFSNIVLTSSDAAIFTADSDVDADGTIDVVGVSVGDASLNVTADATYTDPNTNEVVTVNKSADVPVTISEPAPGAIETDLVVTFSAPQPVPSTGG